MPVFPSTIEIPFKRYLKYAFFWICSGIILGVTFTLIAWKTNWYQQASMGVLNFHLANPFLFVIYVGFMGIVSTIKYYEHKKNVRIKRAEQRRRERMVRLEKMEVETENE